MRVLVAVLSCARNVSLALAQRDTWIAEGLLGPCWWWDYVFFTGGRKSMPPGNQEVSLPVADSWEALPLKSQAMLAWTLDNDYDYVFKCDTDTYVHVERLLGSGFEHWDYSGFYRDPLDSRLIPGNRNYASGGPGYWLSREAMKVVVAHPMTSDYLHPDNPDFGYWNGEDKQVGLALANEGVSCHWDDRYRLDHEYPSPLNNTISVHPVVQPLKHPSQMHRVHKLVKASGL